MADGERKGLGDAELSAIVAQQVRLAKDHDTNERKDTREKALNYYLGKLTDLTAETGRSSVVSHDLSDVVGWMHPGIMRVFTGSDKMASAEPVGPEDVHFADDVTEAINFVFWKENKGYEVVYKATWDALVIGNGIVKTWWDDTPVYKTSFHSGLSDEALALLVQGDEVEVLAHSVEQATGLDGMPVALHEVKIKRQVAPGRFVIDCIPPEKFLIHAAAVDTDDSAFVSQWDDVMRSDLVEMGYDKSKVWAIPEAGQVDGPEDSARGKDENHESPDKSTELVRYYESFLRIDVDGDGEAELVRVCSAGDDGGTLLDWEVWEDEHPFDDIPCEPVPHRWTARSMYDETEDVQRVKTVLLRNALDNIYANQNPQRVVVGKVDNLDEVLNPSFGGVILAQHDSTVTNLAPLYFAAEAFEAISYQDEVVARRTGVSRQSMALDPEALQNQTATAAAAQQDASRSQVELVARNMAEWGWKKVFRKLMRLMIKHQETPKRILVKGEPVEIDPRYWNADMDVSINVGLGTGSRERDATMLGAILQQQTMLADRLTAGGFPDKALEMLPYIRTTLTEFAQSTGIKNPDAYWPEADPQEIEAGKQRLAEQAQKPDPKVQLEQQRAEAQIGIEREKMAADQQNNAAKLQMEGQKAQADFMLKREQMQMEMDLKREQLQAELMLKREQLVAELNLKRELGVLSAQTTVATSAVHPGGEPG